MNTASRNASLDMTHGNITKHLLQFAFPLLIGNIFQQLYNTVDTVIVGNFVGKEALAAVGSTGPIINMLIALFNGLAVGATAILVPEKQIDFERDVIEKIRQARFNGFTHYMIVVAEGAGSASDIAVKIKDAIDLDPRVTVLGHIQRGGVPTGRDRINATKMGFLAVECLLSGKTNRIICTRNGSFTDVDIDEGLSTEKHIQQMEVDVLAAMTGI